MSIKQNHKKIFILILLLFLFSMYSINIFSDKVWYAEQYYEYYVRSMSAKTKITLKNIAMLERALNSPFAPLRMALCKLPTQKQYIRYKSLFRMHVNFLLTKSYIQLASRFDTEEIYYYNYLYKEEIKESLTYAKDLYNIALYYWEQTLNQRIKAEKFEKSRIPLDKWEDEYYLIKAGIKDYKKIIDQRIKEVNGKINYIENWEEELESGESS